MFKRWVHLQVRTSAGAIVMASGIMMEGALKKLGWFEGTFSFLFAVLLLVMLTALYLAYLRDFVIADLWERHLKHPVKSFAVGTWVASISVTALVVKDLMPNEIGLLSCLFVIGCLLMAGYAAVILRNFVRLAARGAGELRRKTNGTILLSCVAVQSIVIAGHVVFREEPYAVRIFTWLWYSGIVMYSAGLLFITCRYLGLPLRQSVDEWESTNCIIHGALSITGLAGASSHIASPGLSSLIWSLAVAAFVGVESMEAARLQHRIREKGWENGVLVYQTEQWSRNFTFGMLVAFSLKFSPAGDTYYSRVLEFVREFIANAGPYLVVLLFVGEALLAAWGKNAESAPSIGA